MWVQSLGQEDPLEEEIATHSSILAWEMPWCPQAQLWRVVMVDVLVPDQKDQGREQSMVFGSTLSQPSRARGCRQMRKQLFSQGKQRHRGIRCAAADSATGCDAEQGECHASHC